MSEDAQNALNRQMHDARSVMKSLACVDSASKNAVLISLAERLRSQGEVILAENSRDIAAARELGYPEPMINRLEITHASIEGMASSLEKIAEFPDPVGAVMAEWQEPNGLHIRRVRTPLGVVGVIYESRPNVTIDAAALCFKSGNPVILRGGKEAILSNTILCNLFQQSLKDHGFAKETVQLVQSIDRALVGQMLQAQGLIDVIVPRGGKTLVSRVMSEARVPIFAHLEGIVHLYLHHRANVEMAEKLIVNAKLRRTSVCGAAECLLVDRAFDKQDLRRILSSLLDQGCVLHADKECQQLDNRIIPATEEDWGREYLSADLAVKVVADQDEACVHIAKYGSGHTDVIVSDDERAAALFIQNVDSAIVMHNASSQFADGGEFGMGAEIGISTGKMHARGPVGLEQLTSFQYHVRGHGAVRA